jgi:hypothetical protein
MSDANDANGILRMTATPSNPAVFQRVRIARNISDFGYTFVADNRSALNVTYEVVLAQSVYGRAATTINFTAVAFDLTSRLTDLMTIQVCAAAAATAN